MNKKYSLGNQPEEFELKTDYLGWFPKGDKNWFENVTDPFYEYKGKEVILVGADNQTVTLILYQMLVKDAFPLSFFGEDRSENWHAFCMVSYLDKPEDKFIIPLH